MTGTAACTGLVRRLARSARKAAQPMSSSAVASARCAVAATTGSSAASTRWPSVWPSGMSRTPAETQLAASACRIGGERGLERDAVAGGGDGDRDRIGDRPVPDRLQPVERGAGPGGARRLDEGIALRRRFQMALLRRRERGGEFGDRAQRLVVVAGRGAMGVGEQHRVAEAAALGQHDAEPALAAFRHP